MSLQTTTWPVEYRSCGVTLKPLGAKDLEMAREWRNDPVIASLMLDKTEINSQMQQ